MESVSNLNQFKTSILPNIINLYPSCIMDENESNDQEVVLRLFFENETVAENFKNEYSKISKTDWIYFRKSNGDLFSKSWICQYSKKRKVNSSKRNADCKAKLCICINKVTNHTKKRYKYLKSIHPLSGLVKISLVHSHDTLSEETLRMRRINEKVKKEFFGYFEEGMTIAEAVKFHESRIKINNSDVEESKLNVFDASVNPTHRQVRHMHLCWTELNSKNKMARLDNKIKEKLLNFESKGVLVKVQDGSLWSVLIVTPVMKQTQTLSSAEELIFVETINISCSSCALTVLFTTTSIGALPIAILIHPAESAFKYSSAFKLLKDSCPVCFGGKSFPKIFMIDDCLSLKVALKSTYPESIQLLSQFHVIQATWKLLFTPELNISHVEKSRLIKLFQAVVYAINEEELEITVQNIIREKCSNPIFVQKFIELNERKTEWIACYRINLLGEQNYMHNYIAEASIRILKFAILQRTKSFSVVSLYEFCVNMLEKYLIRKLKILTQSPQYKLCLIYEHFCTRSMPKLLVTDLGYKLFSVQKYLKAKSFVVDTDVHVCNCADGSSGAFCKHLYYFAQNKHITLPSISELSIEEKIRLSALIPEEKSQSTNFDKYVNIGEDNVNSNTNSLSNSENHLNNNESYSNIDIDDLKTEEIEDLNYDNMDICDKESFHAYSRPTEIAFPSELEVIKRELSRITNFNMSQLTSQEANHIGEKLKTIQSVDDLKTILFS